MQWKRKQKSELAKMASVHPNTLVSIMSGRKDCSEGLARRLEAASIKMFGKKDKIPYAAWVNKAEHPLLKPLSERTSVKTYYELAREKKRAENEGRPVPKKTNKLKSKATEGTTPNVKTRKAATAGKSADKKSDKSVSYLLGEYAKADVSERDYEMPEQEEVGVSLDIETATRRAEATKQANEARAVARAEAKEQLLKAKEQAAETKVRREAEAREMRERAEANAEKRRLEAARRMADVEDEEERKQALAAKAAEAIRKAEAASSGHRRPFSSTPFPEADSSFKGAVGSLAGAERPQFQRSAPRPQFRRSSDYSPPADAVRHRHVLEQADQRDSARPVFSRPERRTPPPMPAQDSYVEPLDSYVEPKCPPAVVIQRPDIDSSSEYIDMSELTPLTYRPEPVEFRVE